MTIAHLIRTIQDQRTGKLVTGATVTLCTPGTETPISEALFSDVLLSQALPNPFVSSSGLVDVYLAAPITVLLKTQYGDSINIVDNLAILPFAENFMISPSPMTILNSPGTNLFLQGVDSSSVEWADLSQTFPLADSVIMGWFLSQALQLDNIVRDGSGAMTAADVTWPDNISGSYTADSVSSLFPGKVDGWSVTRELVSSTVTYSQPEVARDDDGNIVVKPQVEVT